MFNKANEKFLVKNYFLANTNIFYLVGKSIFVNNEKVLELANDNNFSFFITRKYIIIQYYIDGNFEIYDLLGTKIIKLNGYYNYLITEMEVYFFDPAVNSVRCYSNNEVYEYDISNNGYLMNHLYFVIENSTIKTYSLILKNILWTYDLNKLSIGNNEFLNYFVSINDKIYLSTTNNSILCIDLQSGSLLKFWHEFPEVRKYYENGNLDDYLSITSIPYSNCMMLDESSSKLIGLNSFVYWEIDTNNETINSVNLWEEMQKHEIDSINNLTEFVITSSHYIVTGQTNYDEKLNRGKDAIIAFNKESLKIDWLHIFEKEWLGVNVPKYGGGKLYQLDNDGTLHIFEEKS